MTRVDGQTKSSSFPRGIKIYFSWVVKLEEECKIACSKSAEKCTLSFFEIHNKENSKFGGRSPWMGWTTYISVRFHVSECFPVIILCMSFSCVYVMLIRKLDNRFLFCVPECWFTTRLVDWIYTYDVLQLLLLLQKSIRDFLVCTRYYSRYFQLPTKTLIHEWKNSISRPKLFVCILVYSYQCLHGTYCDMYEN